MSGSNGDIDPNAGLCLLQILYNPLNGQCSLSVRNIPNDLIALGMLESAKALYLETGRKRREGQNVVVPIGLGPLGRA